MRMDELDALCRQYPPDHFRRAVSRLIAPRLVAVPTGKNARSESINDAIARTRREKVAA